MATFSGAPPGLAAAALCEPVSTCCDAMLYSFFAFRFSLFVFRFSFSFFVFLPLLSGLYGHRVEEGHHASQLRAHLFDLVILLRRARLVELRPAGLVFLDPVRRERAVL